MTLSLFLCLSLSLSLPLFHLILCMCLCALCGGLCCSILPFTLLFLLGLKLCVTSQIPVCLNSVNMVKIGSPHRNSALTPWYNWLSRLHTTGAPSVTVFASSLSLSLSLTHSLTHTHTHSLTHSLTHSHVLFPAVFTERWAARMRVCTQRDSTTDAQ